MTDNELLKKLQIKPGCLLVINAPDHFDELVKPLPDDVTIAPELSENMENVLVFVKNKADIDKYASQAVCWVIDDGMLWFAYPKGSSKIETDINRDNGWQSLDEEGYRPVRQVSIDKTWSALRFRHKDKVKSRK